MTKASPLPSDADGLQAALRFRWRQRAWLVLAGASVIAASFILDRLAPAFAGLVRITATALIIVVGASLLRTLRRRASDRRHDERRHEERRHEDEPNDSV